MRLRMPVASVIVLALAGLVTPAIAPSVAAAPSTERIVKVTHAAVAPTLVQGEGLGAVRFFLSPTKVNGKAGPKNFMTGTLTTVATGVDGDQELRSSNLTFVFGSEANQIVVGGISLYPSSSATLAAGKPTVRPVIGGSGTYNGARGYVVSTNLGADGWSHVFHLIKNP